jgi:hypothetical protein
MVSMVELQPFGKVIKQFDDGSVMVEPDFANGSVRREVGNEPGEVVLQDHPEKDELYAYERK